MPHNQLQITHLETQNPPDASGTTCYIILQNEPNLQTSHQQPATCPKSSPKPVPKNARYTKR